VANARNAKAVRREEAIFMTAPANLSCVMSLSLAVHPCVRSWNSSCQAIWMASSLPSLDVLGSPVKSGSSVT